RRRLRGLGRGDHVLLTDTAADAGALDRGEVDTPLRGELADQRSDIGALRLSTRRRRRGGRSLRGRCRRGGRCRRLGRRLRSGGGGLLRRLRRGGRGGGRGGGRLGLRRGGRGLLRLRLWGRG